MQGISVIVFATAVVCALGAPQIVPHGNRVLGGEDALPGEFPWTVSLRRSGSHFCGGSIIAADTILTAAHCVVGTNPSSVTVVSGTNTLNAGGNRHAVLSIKTHENYDVDDSWRNDIAIIKLQEPITYSELEHSIPLPAQDEDSGDNNGALSRISGWGYTNYPGFVLPNKLQKLDLELVSNAQCNNDHSLTIYTTQICAGTIRGEGVCNGDSGGPLVADNKQVGIVSWGRSCATGVADVYTRVASYADWIKTNSA